MWHSSGAPPRVVHWQPTTERPRGDERTPWYEMVGSMVYPAEAHPNGPSPVPWYQVRDGRVYPVDGHPDGPSTDAAFVVRDDEVFPAFDPTEPLGGLPCFLLVTDPPEAEPTG